MKEGRADRQTLDLIRAGVLQSKEAAQEEEPEWREISVYRAESRKVGDLGHAVGVVAVHIGAHVYKPTKSSGEKRKLKPKHRRKIHEREGATIKLDEARTGATTDVEHSPETCTTIYPAAHFHYNIAFGQDHKCRTDDVAGLVAEEIVTERDAICEVFIDAKGDETEQPFRSQAETVLKYCKGEPFRLKADSHGDFEETMRMDVGEQVNRLRRLADAIGYELNDA